MTIPTPQELTETYNKYNQRVAETHLLKIRDRLIKEFRGIYFINYSLSGKDITDDAVKIMISELGKAGWKAEFVDDEPNHANPWLKVAAKKP